MSTAYRLGNLVPSGASLVGRSQLQAQVASRVRSDSVVTLTGVGGVGKTRLAVAVGAELAEEFPDGVWLVELAPVADAETVPDVIASALGITPQGGMRVIDAVAEAIAGRRVLIVLDNCEHLLAAATDAVATMMVRSSTARLLATSREALRVPSEVLQTVAPLAAGGVSSDAVTLFVQRARAVRPEFRIIDQQTAESVVQICRTLDGIPLGIELAAARMAAMSAVELHDRLDHRLRLLTGPELASDRQSTLRRAVAWSYDLLPDDERAILHVASVFSGGFELAALCAVCESGDEIDVLRLLDSLVRKSLVVAQITSTATRYSIFETIRAFVDERLAEAAEGEPTRDRHAAYFAGEAARRWEHWNGPGWRVQVDWVQTELANLRSAYRWSLARGQVERATDIAAHAALIGFSVELFETISWAEAVIPAAELAQVARLPRLYAAAGYACFVGRAEAATANAHRATELEGRPGYDPCEPGYATFIEALGQVYCGNLGRYVELTREVAALPGPGRAYGIAAYIDGLQSSGLVDEALLLTDSALDAARELGNPYWLAYTLWIVGLAHSKVNPSQALRTWDEAVAHVVEHDVRFFEGFLSRDAALLHTSDGQLETALSLFGTSIGAFTRSGATAQLVISLASLTALFERLDRPGVARALLSAMAREEGSTHHVAGLTDLAQRLEARLGQEAAERFRAVGAAMDIRDTASYALNQIDRAREALTAAGQGAGGAEGLTARERQVLRLVAGGATTREISERLFISAKTADNHIQHIYAKIGSSNRAAATRWAVDHDLVETADS